MEENFEVKNDKSYSSLSEINKLKKDLSADNFISIEKDKNNSVKIDKKNFNINDFNNPNEEEEKIDELNINKNDEQKNEDKNENGNINISKDNMNIQEDENNINDDNNPQNEIDKDENKENIDIKEESKENLDVEKKEEKEETIQELIPLSYRCLNLDHGDKYITLDRKKQNLICKNCLQSGALETNLELNQEFIEKYQKEQEEKAKDHQSQKNVIKETSEESKNSENEEKINKSNKSDSNQEKEEIESKKTFDIKCLTFQCENKPYYFCEACQDFICYHCIVQRMDINTDKSRHYYHDIESVNYEANSFNDDIKLELETIKKINLSLDYIMDNEKEKNQKMLQKLKNENKTNLLNYIININKNLKSLFLQNNKELLDKYIQKTFENSDNNIKDLQISTINTKSKIKKILEELKIIKDSMNNKDITNEEKCELHQKYIRLVKDANSLIEKGNSIINHSNEELDIINDKKSRNIYEDKDSLSKKILLDNEKSIILNLSNTSKIPGSFKLNRFVTYKHDGLKYFNYSSLELICENDHVLCGLFLCGKYLSTKKIKQNDYSTIPLDQRGFININVKIYEKGQKEPLINENKKLYEVVDINDPVIDISFEKQVKMKKNIKYIIFIENLEKEKYTDIWFGSVLKKLVNGNIQTIRCNNTGNIFNFNRPQELNSDFDEFDSGIIEGILYEN